MVLLIIINKIVQAPLLWKLHFKIYCNFYDFPCKISWLLPLKIKIFDKLMTELCQIADTVYYKSDDQIRLGQFRTIKKRTFPLIEQSRITRHLHDFMKCLMSCVVDTRWQSHSRSVCQDSLPTVGLPLPLAETDETADKTQWGVNSSRPVPHTQGWVIQQSYTLDIHFLWNVFLIVSVGKYQVCL